MPLFGPNFNKMREQRDVAALVSLSINSNHNIRIKAMTTLVELSDVDCVARALANQEPWAPEYRSKALLAVAQLPCEDAHKALLKALDLVKKDDFRRQLSDTLCGVLYHAGDYQSVISFALKALEIDPTYTKIRIMLALSRLHSNDISTAESELKSLLQTSAAPVVGDLHMIHRSLGILYLTEDRWDESGPHIARAIEMNPNDKLGRALSDSYDIMNIIKADTTDSTFLDRRGALFTALVGLWLKPEDEKMPIQLYIIRTTPPATLRKMLETDDETPSDLADGYVNTLTSMADGLRENGKLLSLVSLT